MVNFAFTSATEYGMTGLLDVREAGLDIRTILVMGNSTAGTERDVLNIAAFGTLDESDGANYLRQALANQTSTRVNANDRTEFNHDVIVFANLGAGTRTHIGLIYYHHVTSDADSVPLFWSDEGGFPFVSNGGNVNITPNAAGAAQLIAP